MLYYVLFFFLAMGAKLLLALIMIYLLLPADRSCNLCDEETLLLQLSRGNRWLSVFCLGTLQRRWCPACGWEGYARSTQPAPRAAPAFADPPSPRPDDARKFLN
jgi:hypothetical protein